jgi:hypothetical protein
VPTVVFKNFNTSFSAVPQVTFDALKTQPYDCGTVTDSTKDNKPGYYYNIGYGYGAPPADAFEGFHCIVDPNSLQVDNKQFSVDKLLCSTPCVMKGQSYDATARIYSQQFTNQAYDSSFSYLQCCNLCSVAKDCIAWTWVGAAPSNLYSYQASAMQYPDNTCLIFRRNSATTSTDPGYLVNQPPITTQPVTYASQNTPMIKESAYWWQSGTQDCCPNMGRGDRLVVPWFASASTLADETEMLESQLVYIPYAIFRIPLPACI